MSLVSDDIKQFINFLKMDNQQIFDKYKDECELMNWDSDIDMDNIKVIKSFLKNVYTNDSIFYLDISNVSNHINPNLYRTILKIIDILNLNDSDLDNKVSKIFLGAPIFESCSQ